MRIDRAFSPHSIRSFCRVLFICHFVLFVSSSGVLSAEQSDKVKELIEQFSKGFSEKQKAMKELAAMGEEVVPALVQLIDDKSPRMGEAIQTLGKMGGQARKALPQIKKLITGKVKAPEGWTWNTSPQLLTLSQVKNMGWAEKELVPLVFKIADNKKMSLDARSRATMALGGLGQSGLKKVKLLSRSPNDEIRMKAHYTLGDKAKQGRRAYFAELLEAEPCDPNADDYLTYTKRIVNSGKLNPLVERTKVAIRDCIERKPDPDLVMALANIIKDQLSGTALMWASPSDSSRSRWNRESPKESFHTLLEVLEKGYKITKKNPSLKNKFGFAIARAHLLMGNWKAMNKQLVKMGQKPIPKSHQKLMTAPPHNWENGLAKEWKQASKEMTSGTSKFVLTIEKDGQGLQGAHVLLKPIKEKSNVFRSGIDADTLFLATMPLGWMGGFGYRGGDIQKTRYAVTDGSGRVHITRLPKGPLKLEVMIPTGNFKEEGSAWELWMEVEPGEYKLASQEPRPNSQRPNDALSKVELEEGETTHYPRLVVRPKSALNIHDFASIPAKGFELRWNPPAGKVNQVKYKVELALSAPQQHPSWKPQLPSLRKVTKTLSETRLKLDSKGIEDIPLVPGNFYWVRVTAVDSNEQVVFRSEMTRFWIPWEHRKCSSPLNDSGAYGGSPVFHGAWWRRGHTSSDGTKTDYRGMIKAFLKDKPDAFEREYTEMGEYWLDWRDGKKEKALKGLKKFIQKLPDGNVAKMTAQTLIKGLEDGGNCPKRLNFSGG